MPEHVTHVYAGHIPNDAHGIENGYRAALRLREALLSAPMPARPGVDPIADAVEHTSREHTAEHGTVSEVLHGLAPHKLAPLCGTPAVDGVGWQITPYPERVTCPQCRS